MNQTDAILLSTVSELRALAKNTKENLDLKKHISSLDKQKKYTRRLHEVNIQIMSNNFNRAKEKLRRSKTSYSTPLVEGRRRSMPIIETLHGLTMRNTSLTANPMMKPTRVSTSARNGPGSLNYVDCDFCSMLSTAKERTIDRVDQLGARHARSCTVHGDRSSSVWRNRSMTVCGDRRGTACGGRSNTVCGGGRSSTVCGGGRSSTVCGDRSNTVCGGGRSSTVCGGGRSSTVCGDRSNTVCGGGRSNTVCGGGRSNTICGGGRSNTVCGDRGHTSPVTRRPKTSFDNRLALDTEKCEKLSINSFNNATSKFKMLSRKALAASKAAEKNNLSSTQENVDNIEKDDSTMKKGKANKKNNNTTIGKGDTIEKGNNIHVELSRSINTAHKDEVVGVSEGHTLDSLHPHDEPASPRQNLPVPALKEASQSNQPEESSFRIQAQAKTDSLITSQESSSTSRKKARSKSLEMFKVHEMGKLVDPLPNKTRQIAEYLSEKMLLVTDKVGWLKVQETDSKGEIVKKDEQKVGCSDDRPTNSRTEVEDVSGSISDDVHSGIKGLSESNIADENQNTLFSESTNQSTAYIRKARPKTAVCLTSDMWMNVEIYNRQGKTDEKEPTASEGVKFQGNDTERGNLPFIQPKRQLSTLFREMQDCRYLRLTPKYLAEKECENRKLALYVDLLKRAAASKF